MSIIRRHHGSAERSRSRHRRRRRRGEQRAEDRHEGPARRAVRQHHPLPRRRRGGEGEVGPPRHADGHGRHGLRSLDRVPAPRSECAALEQPRPLRPLRRPRLDAALLAAASDRLSRHDHGRSEAVPAVGIEDRWASGVRPRLGHRGDDRSARPGIRPQRRHGARREDARRAIRYGRFFQACRSLHLRHLLGRRSGRRHQLRGRLDRRPPRPRQSHLLLRRQQHLDRRGDAAGVFRGREEALRGVPLARADHRRPRSGRRAQVDPQGAARERPAVAHHRADDHRLGLAEVPRHRARARRAARRGRSQGHEGSARLAAGADVLRAGRSARGVRAQDEEAGAVAEGLGEGDGGVAHAQPATGNRVRPLLGAHAARGRGAGADRGGEGGQGHRARRRGLVHLRWS